jgi:hypothetical protein
MPMLPQLEAQGKREKRQALGALLVLTSFDRRSENIRVLPIVIAELELGDIEWHVFTAHFMERANHAALENRPEALMV